MNDVMQPIGGNKMLELKAEIADLKKLLKETDDPDKQKAIRSTINDKQMNYNILADRLRMRG